MITRVSFPRNVEIRSRKWPVQSVYHKEYKLDTLEWVGTRYRKYESRTFPEALTVKNDQVSMVQYF
jgi:hypothetical protein